MKVWNYNEADIGNNGIRKGVKLADIEVSRDGVNWTTAINNQGFLEAPGLHGSYGQPVWIKLGGVRTRYLRIKVKENFGDPDSCGLSEVQFYADRLN